MRTVTREDFKVGAEFSSTYTPIIKLLTKLGGDSWLASQHTADGRFFGNVFLYERNADKYLTKDL